MFIRGDNLMTPILITYITQQKKMSLMITQQKKKKIRQLSIVIDVDKYLDKTIYNTERKEKYNINARLNLLDKYLFVSS